MPATIKIDGKRFDLFTSLNIQLNHADIASAFSFQAYFDSQNEDHKRLFRPFAYKECIIENEGRDKILTGTILSSTFQAASSKSLSSISGYSKSGVLNDCTIAAANYPLQKNNLSLLEIAREVCRPFGISVFLSRDAPEGNEKFETVIAEPNESIAKFLIDLASQKNLVINHDINGNLLIELVSTFSRPVAFFSDGQPDVEISLQCNGQALNSQITLLSQADVDSDNAIEETFDNPYVSKFRPLVKKQTSGTDASTLDAAKNSVLSQLRNAIKVNITLDRWTWRNDSPELVIPNRLIEVESPSCFLFNRTKLFVESVNLLSDTSQETAVLSCVIPEIFQGGQIKNIFA